ncbi:MAG: hypothetical protein H8D23_36420 [Candidatus Brocadiales bacterium]|nr:hypothetical protein [Candidatus Brocadiales bacterium]MBL7005944.1 hypothetical protein [Spirochaetia bacterium]
MSAIKKVPLISFTIFAALFLAGCVHKTPFQEESYFSSLGREGEFVITVNLEDSGALKDKLLVLLPDDAAVEYITSLTSRLSVSAILPVYQEDGTYSSSELGYYGALEGNISMPLFQTVLCIGNEWKRVVTDSFSYWENTVNGLQIAVPENGIALFSQYGMDEVYKNTYVQRDIFVPLEIADRISDGLIGIYVEKPRYLFSLLEGVIPYTLLISIKSVWITVDSDNDSYSLYGVIETTQKAATTVISLTLKKKYLEKIRKLEEKPENWKESILVDSSEEIIINNMEIDSNELIVLIQTLIDITNQEQ